MEPIAISVALVTRNRPRELERCLASWRAQAHQPFEIVVSDDSDDLQRRAVFNLAQRFGTRYEPGPRRGLYANRNAASLACQGSHIMSADDDHTHPGGFFQAVSEMVGQDPGRIWTFGEKHPSTPDQIIARPAELHVSGAGCAPVDYTASAAIADGASVYPRTVFDRGFRYDETYRFGGMWYLFGKVLKKAGWRITFSDRTFVWHHFTAEERKTDRTYLREQLCCNTYASLVNSLHVNRSTIGFLWGLAYLAKRMVVGETATGYLVKARITPLLALQLARSVARAGRNYRELLQ
jgi:glycosyltransferase involved in cell wall biosynthesis